MVDESGMTADEWAKSVEREHAERAEANRRHREEEQAAERREDGAVLVLAAAVEQWLAASAAFSAAAGAVLSTEPLPGAATTVKYLRRQLVVELSKLLKVVRRVEAVRQGYLHDAGIRAENRRQLDAARVGDELPSRL